MPALSATPDKVPTATMLTSSDAKWRCLWHMMVWSIMLTLVSQFLGFANHIVFYIFASLSMLILPVLTAVYSNTSGRHGAGLLRAGYVFCDPVLSCITVTPVLMINGLPSVLSLHGCLTKHELLNDTCACVQNRSIDASSVCHVTEPRTEEFEREQALWNTRKELLIMQLSLVAPILLSLLMGRRTRKMKIQTALITFAYWFVVAIEAADLIDTARRADIYKHVIFTTEAVISIAMIIINSYAIVTLCSYISPGADRDKKQYERRFDTIYKVFVAVAGVFLIEIPLIIARLQILANDFSGDLPGTFFVWLIKDMLFLGLIIVAILVDKLGKKYVRMPCRINLDNSNVFFQPEKRDAYIVRSKQVRFQDPPVTMFMESDASVIDKPTGGKASPASNNSKAPVSILQNSVGKAGSAAPMKKSLISLPPRGVRPRKAPSYGLQDSSDEENCYRDATAGTHVYMAAKPVSGNPAKCQTSQCVKCGKIIDWKSSSGTNLLLGSQNSDAEQESFCGDDMDSTHSGSIGVPGGHSLSLDSGTGTWLEDSSESPPARVARLKQLRPNNNLDPSSAFPQILEIKSRTEEAPVIVESPEDDITL